MEYLIFADTEAEARQWAESHNITSWEYADPQDVDAADYCDGNTNVISLKAN